MDRYWLLTWCTYGSWLPGDARGFVGRVRDESGSQVIHNIPGTPCDANLPNLERYARSVTKCRPVRLTKEQAEVLLAQFQATADFRCWQLLAVAIMANHVHSVVGVPGDPEPADILGDFKSYGSRALNRQWPKPESGTWWSESGSKRKLATEESVLAAIMYLINQESALVIWTAPIPELGLQGGRIV